MTTQNEQPNTTVPHDVTQNTPVPAEESETAGRGKQPNTTVPRDDAATDTTVPRDDV